jgi:glycosyltransferase involved in cell wall biosynthesis
VWSPPAIPFHGSSAVRWFNARLVSRLLRSQMERARISRPLVWSYLPHAVEIVERLPHVGVAYHCIDDYRAFTDAPTTAFADLERQMLASADVTVVSARELYRLRAPDARRIAYMPHGVDFEAFQAPRRTRLALPDVDALPRPIAGFVGRIADWIDLDLIVRAARLLDDWTFVLVGPTNVDLRVLRAAPNIYWLGSKPHDEIPHYIDRFDVCLMPFALNEVSASTNPLKMYEYLAVGKPVVTTPLPELAGVAEPVDIVEPDPRAFAAAIVAARDGDTPERQGARRAAVAGRSWHHIADSILALLDGDDVGAAPAEPERIAS